MNFSFYTSHAMNCKRCQVFLFSRSPLQFLSCRLVGYQIKGNVQDCYSLLNVTDVSSDEEVREAYLKLAKIYHPDSGTSSADPRKFHQVREAYMTIKVKSFLYSI